jgi:hypothetical protein
MDNSQTQTPPWEDIASPTAIPPSVIGQDTKPWEDIGSSFAGPPVASSYPEPRNVDQQGMISQGGTPEQLMQVAGGMGVGELAGSAVSGVAKLFENVPDLLDAGIKPQTLKAMTPEGMTPSDYGPILQKQLNSEGLLGKTSNDTLKNFISDTDKAGADVGSARNAIAQAKGPQAVTVNAQDALQPIYDAWSKEVNANVPDGRTLKIIGDQYNGLMKTAQAQGGQLTLDNIHNFLQEIGPKVHAGSEANQAIYSNLYKVGMDTQKGMVNTVAKQAGDPTLASNLLDANARFTRNLRLLPDVATNDAKEAIKAGVSAFQKYGGPTMMKYAGGGFAALTGEHLIGKLYHVITGGD